MIRRSLHVLGAPTAQVPCDGCTSCCQQQVIELHEGDRPKLYKWRWLQGRRVLEHKPNGDCIYLERGKGCSIWKRRPVQCRTFDCRDAVLDGLLLGPEITTAALARMPEKKRAEAVIAVRKALQREAVEKSE